MSATDQFTENPQLTAIAIAYRNPDQVLIADEVLPRCTAPARNFSWTSYNEAEAFSVPNTQVGRRSTPNRVEIEGTQETASCEDYGIDIPLDRATMDEVQKNGVDPKARAVERATSIIALDREARVAALICDPKNYDAKLVKSLGGAESFDAKDSDPITAIEQMLDNCWMRPNQLTFGQSAWRAIARHPKVVAACHANSGEHGRASREAVAELLEVSRILVGAGRVNIRKPGAKPVLARVWGNMVAGQYIDRTADTNGGLTFGFTAQHGTRVGGTLPANMGLRGGILVRSGETLVEKIVASRAGFLLQNVTKGQANA